MIRSLRGWLLLIPAALALVSGLLVFVSSESISGRQIQGENRFGNWGEILSSLSPADFLVGRSLGVGTNASYLANGDPLSVPVSDSQLIAQLVSTGLVGVIVMLIGVAKIGSASNFDGKTLVIPTMVLAGLVFNIAEYYPTNIILALLASVCLSLRRQAVLGDGDNLLESRLARMGN